MLLFFFKPKMSYLLSQAQITLNSYILRFFLKSNLLFYTLIYSLWVFHYFGLHGRPTSQIFNPLLFFDYFNPAIIFINKRNCALGVLSYSFGPKQPRLVILRILISRLGTKICLYELIFHAHIKENNTSIICFMEQIKMIK